MTERDRPAQRIHFRPVKSEVPDHREALRGESLVQLDPGQRVLFQPHLL